MNEDQFTPSEGLVVTAQTALEDRAALSTRMNLPRAPRVGTLNRSYCAETAWVWQRARLVCAEKKPTP
jgi:hypothetical protein